MVLQLGWICNLTKDVISMPIRGSSPKPTLPTVQAWSAPLLDSVTAAREFLRLVSLGSNPSPAAMVRRTGAHHFIPVL
jgi:hypothetical protein